MHLKHNKFITLFYKIINYYYHNKKIAYFTKKNLTKKIVVLYLL